jgi:adenylosuccinate lyase
MTDSISPTEGRYSDACENIRQHMSERSHYETCVYAELAWYKSMCANLGGKMIEFPSIPYNDIIIGAELSEATTKHDIKSIEMAVRWFIEKSGLPHPEYVHIGLTSQDIVSLSVNSRVKDCIVGELLPQLYRLATAIQNTRNGDAMIYARTHGQKGVVTTFGSEMSKYHYRLVLELKKLHETTSHWSCKFGGANGGFESLELLRPDIKWEDVAHKYLTHFKLTASTLTTQTDNWRSLVDAFGIIRNISNILLDYCQDMWMYYMNGDIILSKEAGQIGSSVMPQKINPIDFENAEGNLQMVNMWSEFLTSKFQVSRLQRDLSDSVVIRHIGIPLANLNLAIRSISSGIAKVVPIGIDGVHVDYKIFGELLQTYMRLSNMQDAYEIVREKMQHHRPMTLAGFCDVVNEVGVTLPKHVWTFINSFRCRKTI